MLRHTLAFYGHVGRRRAFWGDARWLAVLWSFSLRSSYGDYEDTVALRNSHDKKFPVGIGFGERVFCCDNLSFIVDHVIRRKHTANAKRDLPGLIAKHIAAALRSDQPEALAADVGQWRRSFDRQHFIRQ